MIAELQEAQCLSHAARLWLPKARSGKPVHASVLSRWSDRGVLAPDGTRVYLETRRFGGQRVTTRAFVENFLAALNPGTATATEDSEAESSRRSRESGAALEKLGC